jgi:hypothetical protein
LGWHGFPFDAQPVHDAGVFGLAQMAVVPPELDPDPEPEPDPDPELDPDEDPELLPELPPDTPPLEDPFDDPVDASDPASPRASGEASSASRRLVGVAPPHWHANAERDRARAPKRRNVPTGTRGM